MAQSIDKREIVAGILTEMQCNPFEILANLASSPLVDASVRRAAASDLAGYVAPKLKPAEIEAAPKEKEVHHPVDISNFRELPAPDTPSVRARVSPADLPGSRTPTMEDLTPDLPPVG